jgi:hypothetical protein
VKCLQEIAGRDKIGGGQRGENLPNRCQQTDAYVFFVQILFATQFGCGLPRSAGPVASSVVSQDKERPPVVNGSIVQTWWDIRGFSVAVQCPSMVRCPAGKFSTNHLEFSFGFPGQPIDLDITRFPVQGDDDGAIFNGARKVSYPRNELGTPG